MKGELAMNKEEDIEEVVKRIAISKEDVFREFDLIGGHNGIEFPGQLKQRLEIQIRRKEN